MSINLTNKNYPVNVVKTSLNRAHTRQVQRIGGTQVRGRTARNLAIGLGAAGSLGGLAAAAHRAVSQTLNGEGKVISVTRLTRGGFAVIASTNDGGDVAFFTTQPEASKLETGQELRYNVSLLKPQRNGMLTGTFTTS